MALMLGGRAAYADSSGYEELTVGFLKLFFFSSRRRHTRLQVDWSSDVCSSDLFDPISRIENVGHSPTLSRDAHLLFDPGRSKCLPRILSGCCPNYLITSPLESMSLPLTGFLLSNCRLPRDFKLVRIVVHPGQSRWGLKRIVQPCPQIAIKEQLLPQQRRQRRQRPGERRFQLQVLQQQHGDQSRPNLGLHRIGAGPHKCLDFAGLLQRLKEQLHLPAVLVDGRKGRRAEGQQVGEEHDGLLLFLVPDLYPPEQHWLLALPRQPGKADDLVAHHVAVSRNLQFFLHVVNRLLLHPRHDVHFLLRQFPKPLVIDVAAVDRQDRARREPQRACHFDLTGLAFRHYRERRQVAIVVQQQVQFDRALGPPDLCPIEHAHRQVDDAPVQAHQLVLEAELLTPALAAHQFLAFEQRLLEHRLVQLPRPILIGIGQGGPLGRYRHPQMLQLPLAASQASANLAQRMRPSQLAKQHRHELTPTGETPRVPLGLLLLDRLREFPSREKLQHLRENAAYSVHRLSLLRLNWFLSGTQSHPTRRLSLSQPDVSELHHFVSPLIWTAVIQCRRGRRTLRGGRARAAEFKGPDIDRAGRRSLRSTRRVDIFRHGLD